MQRRTLLIRLCQTIAATATAVLIIPIGRFISAPLFRKNKKSSGAQRVAKLTQLPVGTPTQVAIIGNRQDGWTLHPQAVIGKVWLIRRNEESEKPEDCQVDAYSAICPHLGCGINHSADDLQFVCPCHEAVFDDQGAVAKLDKPGYNNPSPRGMDTLDCQVVASESGNDLWVEVEYERFKIGLKDKVNL
ncbi:Cytochrome b6-f complex iron-sulfur subunit [Polystyrenella longa]|uniref:Cytochrome b6-f complex iron-sulfur subunit n=1 Tax=Polystyrenella longa TaxID=2528007 RepID=A0A518CMX3_9PLAN|nr:Rieske 2Fe-2S domain-containing protein [Polystyrenella longa]QDU80569.1 Cytochrome b6-f complex iron-sulfur subunit [Polystyrenella longa]